MSTQSPLAPVVGVSDTGWGKSRLFADSPHTDGLIIVGADSLVSHQSGPDALVLTRALAGRWTLSRTAAGAETYYIRLTLGELLKIGEPFQFGDFGGPGVGSTSKPYPPKGIGVLDMFVSMQIGVAALTSATLRLGKTVYSKTLDPVPTDILAATALGSLAPNGSSLIQVVSIPLADQVFFTDDFSLPEIEFSFVMANTGVISIEAMGAHVSYNYN